MDWELHFETEPAERAGHDPTLVVDVGGFEGPLDLLLDLARRHRIDLHEISILALAEQYLAFVDEARSMRLELAADYLVMAAWLAYLKSRLLLPEPPRDEGPSAGDLATALAFRLRRLEALRDAARRLGEREQLGRDVFARGEPQPVVDRRRPVYEASLFELLAAYAGQRQKRMGAHVTLARRQVWSLAEARAALERLLGQALDWTELGAFVARYLPEPAMRPSVLASSLSAALEMVREGKVSLRQDAAFAPLMLRRREPAIRLVGP